MTPYAPGPGHPKHERPEFPPEQIDQTQDYTLTQCPDCGGKLQNAAAAPRLIQQVEISDKPVRIEEHRGLAYWCRHCQRVHYGALPQAVEKLSLTWLNSTTSASLKRPARTI